MPGGDTGRSVIGRTNIDGVGIAGLELQYDDLLTGTGGRDAPRGRARRPLDPRLARPSRSSRSPGNDLVLTLDRSIQFSTEQVLLEQVAAIGARGATAIVMDTDTGEIYSMASVRRDDETGVYEVTVGQLRRRRRLRARLGRQGDHDRRRLNEGLVTPETTYVVPWRKQYYDDLLEGLPRAPRRGDVGRADPHRVVEHRHDLRAAGDGP